MSIRLPLTHLLAVAAIAALQIGCQNEVPAEALFGGVDAQPKLDTGSGLDASAPPVDGAAQPDTGAAADAATAPDVTKRPGDAASGDAGAADTVQQDTGGTDTGGTDAGGTDAGGQDGGGACVCASDPDCAGVAVGPCQEAVCAKCQCQVVVAGDGAPCGGDKTCQKGQCLPPTKPGKWAVGVSAGGTFSCARHPDGTASCWGANDAGQLGKGSATNEETSPKAVLGLKGVSAMAAGDNHACALHGGGLISCWGDRFYGQTGSGQKYGMALAPEAVVGIADGLAIGGSSRSTLAVRKGHTLWGWGSNDGDLMQLGSTLSQPEPKQITSQLSVAQGCSGYSFACDRTTAGEVRCWGRNDWGQAGQGKIDVPTVAKPGAVLGLPAVVGVSCGHYHACAWAAGGKVWCWGKNISGQLGNGGAVSIAQAVPVEGLTDVARVSAAQGHTCALRTSGQVLCWGDNDDGETGTDTGAKDVLKPAAVTLPGKAVDVATGKRHSCAALEDGPVWCWGDNNRGQLGDGSTTPSAKPVLVQGSGGK